MRKMAIAAWIACLCLGMVSCMDSKGSLVLVNQAGEPVARGTVSICGQTIKLDSIEPAKQVTVAYKVTSDSHYDIEIAFRSGKTIRKSLGYVMSGFTFHDRAVITDTDIVLESRKTN